MTSRFDPLFSIKVSHAYYGGSCKDIGFVVPRDTAKLLRGARMTPKMVGAELYVLFEGLSAGVPLLSAAGRTLRFGLSLQNAQFVNFTDFGFDLTQATPCYRNGASVTELDAPVQRTLVGNVFAHALESAARPVTVTLKDAGLSVVHTETITAAHDRSALAFDLTGDSPGACTVEELYPGNVTHARAYYLDPELAQGGVLGIIEIRIDSAFYSAPPVFQVSYQARQETLKYYFVTKNYTNVEFNQLAVSDAGFAEEQRAEVTFTKVPAAAFTPAEIPAAMLGNGDTKIVLFKSEAPVARQQRGRKKIQLKRQNDVLIEHLPQPGADRADANLIIHLSKP